MITSKKLNKKLTLKKETIADLKKNEMQRIYGGEETKNCTVFCSFPFTCKPV
jgi:natural product precursor